MDTEHIGYSLVDDAGNEVAFWGNTPGQCEAFPSQIRLPNGETIYCGGPCVLGDFLVVERHFVAGPESITFEGTKVIVSRPL